MENSTTTNLVVNQNLKETGKPTTIYRMVHDKKNPYVQINKTSLQDERLSWKAKGLHSYMLTLPDDWTFHREELTRRSSDGMDCLKSAIKELVSFGYIHIHQLKGESGKFGFWETLIFETPELNPYFNKPDIHSTESGKSTSGENRVTLVEKTYIHSTESGKTASGKPTDIVNNNINNNNFNKTTTRSSTNTAREDDDEDEVVSLFDRLEKLQKGAVTLKTLKNHVERYGFISVHEKVYLAEKSSPSSVGAFLVAALKNNYKTIPEKQKNRFESDEEILARRKASEAEEQERIRRREEAEQSEIAQYGRILTIKERMDKVRNEMKSKPDIKLVYSPEFGAQYISTKSGDIPVDKTESQK